MISSLLTHRIGDIIPGDRLFKDEPMSRHTSFRIGGPAALLVQVNSENELSEVLEMLNESGTEHMIIGNGSNLLVSDEGYPGAAVKLGGEFADIKREEGGCMIRAGAARLMSGVSSYLTENGLSGFEFASGIPGSVGGAVYMNAGAYGGEMKDITESVRVMKACDPAGSSIGEIVDFSNKEMAFGYRTSRAQSEDMVILSVVLRLREGDPKEIAERVSELTARRNSKQPVNYPSAGSTFKRPAEGYAAALIEEAGLKGYRAGGAAVSDKHAGFVINEGGASCDDVLTVMRHVRETVLKRSGIELEPEVRLINCSL